MIENVHSVCINTAYVCAAGVGAVAVAYGAARGMKFLSGGVKCVTAVSLAGSLIFGGMVVTSVHVAGAKTNDMQQVGGDLSNTNDVGQVEGGTNVLTGVQGRARSPSAPQGTVNGESNGPALRRVRRTCPTGMVSITDDDIAQGWRVVSVSSNALAAATFTMPPHASVWEDARDFGAGWGSWKIPFGGWRFAYGDVGWTNGFAWVEGYFRSRFNSRANEIRLLDERLALCPAANWSRYNLAASRAWSVTNDVGGLVVTFENAAIADDPMKIASVQLELFPRTGEVALRYDLANVGDATYTAGLVVDGTNHFVEVGAETREVVFQRVHPQDWDMDGLPNSLDPEPRNPTACVDYNQNDTWAMLAFPSNAAEIAAVGFAAWARQRAADPNRRLVALKVASKEGAYPVCLNFGNTQVMCDGTEEILFPVDCGARYAFSVSGGELARVSVPDTAAWDTTWFDGCEPREFCVGDVTVCQESASSGWLCRTADVEVDGLECAHFFPNDSRTFTAVVTNCHANAYVDCIWSGGEGVTFSNRYSLETVIAWQTTNSVTWATNRVTLVTNYEGGYAITNGYVISVGPQSEPTTTLLVDCQAVQFVNDGLGGNRFERHYPVTISLVASPGVGGTVRFSCSGQAMPNLFWDRNGDTPYGGTYPLQLEIPESGGFVSSSTLYLSSNDIGRGTVNAVLELKDGRMLNATVGFQVIEPIRRLVTSERFPGSPAIVNPSCLVLGTNAVLQVEVNAAQNDSFAMSNVIWKVVKGPGVVTPIAFDDRKSTAILVPKSNAMVDDIVEVEARFNSDRIQPHFTLPVVQPRVVPVRAFCVQPPLDEAQEKAWSTNDINRYLSKANDVFSQVGISFELLSVTNLGVNAEFWNLQISDVKDSEGNVVKHDRSVDLANSYTNRDCVELYFTGKFSDDATLAFWIPEGIILSSRIDDLTLAHELGHALGLMDCFYTRKGRTLDCADLYVTRSTFVEGASNDEEVQDENAPNPVTLDWWHESWRGFYTMEDRVRTVIDGLLMHGMPEDGKFDIPGATVVGLDLSSVTNTCPVYIGVGYDLLNKENREVISK